MDDDDDTSASVTAEFGPLVYLTMKRTQFTTTGVVSGCSGRCTGRPRTQNFGGGRGLNLGEG